MKKWKGKKIRRMTIASSWTESEATTTTTSTKTTNIMIDFWYRAHSLWLDNTEAQTHQHTHAYRTQSVTLSLTHPPAVMCVVSLLSYSTVYMCKMIDGSVVHLFIDITLCTAVRVQCSAQARVVFYFLFSFLRHGKQFSLGAPLGPCMWH